MVLELARPASWDDLAKVWRGVQADLELPAPSIAVSGIDGYQLWFSLSQPIPVAQAMAFLKSLRGRYLGDIAPGRIAMKPSVDPAPGQARHGVLPPVERAAGRWSAFVAPDLAALFADEPWLDLPPGPDAQADLLSQYDSIEPADFKRALEQLRPVDMPGSSEAPPPVGVSGSNAGHVHAPLAAAADGASADPRRFLLGIMNDATIEMHLRIEAAKALLPYFEGHHPL